MTSTPIVSIPNASNFSNASNDYHDLLSTTLSSTSYNLTYSIPLLLVSCLLTFAGAFLTLDRTRTFTPRQPLGPTLNSRMCPARFTALLEGGIGGVTIGFAFGMHLSTFLSLLIPTSSGSHPLNAKAFLAVCFLSAIICSLAAGRWRYVALTLAGCGGYTGFSLALSIILHPTLLTRIILAAVLIVLGTLCCLAPLPKYSRVPVRFAASAVGSFGMVLAISLLARVPSWSNVWARFWASNDIDWGTSAEKGLSAAFCILCAVGVVTDWFLHRYFGENPDERWDHYLSDYGDSLPNDRNRAGLFEPARSFWDHLLSRQRPSHSVLLREGDRYADDLDTKLPPESLLPPERRISWRHINDVPASEISPLSSPGLLRQPRQRLFALSANFRSTPRKIQFSPVPSDSATLANMEAVDNCNTRLNEHEPGWSHAWTKMTSPPSVPQEENRWTMFWHDVRAKAHSVYHG